MIQDDVLAGNPQQEPVPKHDQSLFFISLLHYCNSSPEHCHAVTFFQGPLVLLTLEVFLARLDNVDQPRRIIA